MPEPRALTPTSYAILGLLAVKPWTTYELATQMDRTLSRFWPRARSKLYEEPKKLVAQGLASAAAEPHGRRPRTVYSITARRAAGAGRLAGRRRARAPVFESEHVLKVFYAENGTTADLLATLADLRTWVHGADRAQRRGRLELPGGRRAVPGRLADPGADRPVPRRLSGDARPLGGLGRGRRWPTGPADPATASRTSPRWRSTVAAGPGPRSSAGTVDGRPGAALPAGTGVEQHAPR